MGTRKLGVSSQSPTGWTVLLLDRTGNLDGGKHTGNLTRDRRGRIGATETELGARSQGRTKARPEARNGNGARKGQCLPSNVTNSMPSFAFPDGRAMHSQRAYNGRTIDSGRCRGLVRWTGLQRNTGKTGKH